MYTFKENLIPIRKQYNKWINGYYLSNLLQFKGQRQIGGEYVSKVFRSQSYQYRKKYQHVVTSVQNPTFFGFVNDNIFRLLFLNCVQRLTSACQVVNSLFRPNRPSSTSFLFTEIMNDGAFRGTLRGLSMNFLQTSLVIWPAVVLTNKTQGGFFNFLLTFTVLDAILHPIDTVKNKMYAQTQHPLKLRNALASVGLLSSYNGVFPKFIFNIPYGAALYFTATDNELLFPAWLATLIAYPLHSIKSVVQVSSSIPQLKNLYRGVIPFMFVNCFFAWKMLGLYPKNKFNELEQDIKKQSIQDIGYY